ncbi:hypothetical protein [Kitasatospora sp. NPDC086791]|uniref:hypothetical protein n=1 Tax=Kitasatospora sp. NPDC086791 TaxID=3155178 RepID=UPI003446FAD9
MAEEATDTCTSQIVVADVEPHTRPAWTGRTGTRPPSPRRRTDGGAIDGARADG